MCRRRIEPVTKLLHGVTWIQFHVFNHEIMFECCRSGGKWVRSCAQAPTLIVSSLECEEDEQRRHLRIIQHSRRLSVLRWWWFCAVILHAVSENLLSPPWQHHRVGCHSENADKTTSDTICRFFQCRSSHENSFSSSLHFQGHKNKVYAREREGSRRDF